MIVIPPQDPDQRRSDPSAEALGPLYEQFTNVQNLAEFHSALRKRDALYGAQHREMGDSPQDYENLHPKDFYDQFHRRADQDDKSVVSEAPYPIRQQLRDVLAPERNTAADDLNRATAVVYGEMTGSEKINQNWTFRRIERASGQEVPITMTKLGHVGEAYGLASILWNRLEKPAEYSSSGQPKPKDLNGIITSKGQFISVGKDRYNQVMNGRVDDPQAYELAREAVERTARFGPSFNFDSNRATLPNASATKGAELREGWVNMGSGTDFGRIRP
jgi:hypothetical protein